MSRHLTIYGPEGGTRLIVMSDKRMVELSFDTVKTHFGLQEEDFSLRPLTLSGIQVKLGRVKDNNGNYVFSLDHDQHQFYKVDVSRSSRQSSLEGSKASPIEVDSAVKCSSIKVSSILGLIRRMPLHSNLYVALQQIKEVKELPLFYDGYVAYELPPSRSGSGMTGMEQKHDCHVWTEYVTCSSDCFDGVVRFSRCSGHLRCINVDCPYYLRLHIQNENQWRGRLVRSCLVGMIAKENGSLACFHCGQMPECLAVCPAVIYYCLPKDKFNYTRCAIHLGEHKHPCAEGRSRAVESQIEGKLEVNAMKNPFSTPKQLERVTTQEIILERLVGDSGGQCQVLEDDEFSAFLDSIAPMSSNRRVERCLLSAKQSRNLTSKGLEAVLELKTKCRYPFIQSVLYPGQLKDKQQPHVFKMSVKGPGSGVDLVNRMRPGGNLEHMWVHFDHVHRVQGWPTMSAHVYDPYVRELLTIAASEFTVENKYAQIDFWNMLNRVVIEAGFEKPDFRGFMADEANANWIAVRTVYFGGPKNINFDKERSCVFHWEQSMVRHTIKCIHASFQEEHKILCRKWRSAPSETAAEMCKGELRRFWKAGHAIEGEVPSLETWLSWWDVRVPHWGSRFVSQDDSGAFIPTTNLSEAKHASMRASIGYKDHITLYEASCADMAMAVLQSVRYNAYLKGIHSAHGPGIKDLADRFLNENSSRSAAKRLVDLTHSSMHEIGIPTAEASRSAQERSTRRKRPAFVDADVVLDEDSHRPEYITVTTPIGGQQKPNGRGEDHGLWQEIVVAKTMWAIRRTEPGQKVTCFGVMGDQRERCGRFINESSLDVTQGVAAPCFWGRKKYPPSGSRSRGIVEGFIWFCNNTNTHTWKVHDMVVGPPGRAPGVWPVSKGTNLKKTEANLLHANGFVLSGKSNNTDVHGAVSMAHRVPSGFCPKYQDGKIIK